MVFILCHTRSKFQTSNLKVRVERVKHHIGTGSVKRRTLEKGLHKSVSLTKVFVHCFMSWFSPCLSFRFYSDIKKKIDCLLITRESLTAPEYVICEVSYGSPSTRTPVGPGCPKGRKTKQKEPYNH